MVTLVRTDSESVDFKALVALLDQDLAIRDGDDHGFYHQFNSIDAIRHAVVCYVDGVPAGCGAFKPFDVETVEIKRMYVPPSYRRQGLARKILVELEKWCAEEGYSYTILETGQAQPEAIALYTDCGYQIIPNYGQYVGVDNSVCFSKKLD